MVTNKFSRVPPTTPEEFMEQAAMTGTSVDPMPAPARTPVVEQVTSVSPTVPVRVAPVRQAKPAPVEIDESVYRTLTLRLTKDRYKTLKMLSTVSETPIQQLLVEALDDYLVKRGKVG